MEIETKPRNRELSIGLLRQRRNILISSVAVVTFIALGFELTELRLLGNVAKVNNPHVVPILIFVVHCYFTLRYWQYYLEENHIPKVFEVLDKNIREYETAFLKEKALSSLNNLYHFEHVNFNYPRYDILTWGEPHQKIEDVNTSTLYKNVCVHSQIYSDDRFEVFDEVDDEYTFNKSYKDQELWKIHGPQEDHWGNSSGVIIEGWVTCFRLAFPWFKCRAVAKYIIKQSYFTDYQLPLVIAFVSLLFGIVTYLGGMKI